MLYICLTSDQIRLANNSDSVQFQTVWPEPPEKNIGNLKLDALLIYIHLWQNTHRSWLELL